MARPADPEWAPLLEALDRLRHSGAFGMRVVRGPEGESAIIIFRAGSASEPSLAQAIEDGRFVRETLGLGAAGEIELEFGLLAQNDRQLAVASRSMLEILANLASGFQVPDEHIAAGWTRPSSDPHPRIGVMSSKDRPSDAFVAAEYLGHWFYLPQSDFESKRLFTFLSILFSLAESGNESNVPAVTISAGG